MNPVKVFAAALTLAVPTLLTSTVASADDEIVIYRAVESSVCTGFDQPTTFETTDPDSGDTVDVTFPGSKFKWRDKQTLYVIFNKSTGEYREVFYRSFISYDENGKRFRHKEYSVFSDPLGPNEGYSPSSLFETDPSQRRNYYVLSFQGTGNDLNHFNDQDVPMAGDSSMGVNTETLAGVVKNQRVRYAMGVMNFFVPGVISGPVSRENQYYSGADDRFSRTACNGKKTLRLDKARTREFLDGGGMTMQDAENAVVAFLESRGYEPAVGIPVE